MSHRALTLKARLLGFQLLVFGGLVLLASPLAYLLMSRTLRHDRDRHLAAMAGALAEEYLVKGNRADPTRPCLPEPVLPDSPEPSATHRPRHLLVCDGTGQVLCGDGEPAPLAPQAVRQALATSSPAYADVRWPAETLRLVAWPFRDLDRRALVMEVGASHLVMQDALRQGLALITVVDLATLGFLLVGGHLLTRRAFAPIEQIISRVEGIDEANLAERLPAEPRSDEAGRLVVVLNRLLQRLERAFEAQRRFASDLAHEVRSPLTALRGQIEVALRRQRTRDEYVLVLKESLEEVLRLSRLAEDLMSLARADAGVLEVRRESLDLREVLRRVAARFHMRAEEKNIRLVLDAPEAVTMAGDPDLLGRLLDNLVDNAIIHSPRMEEVRLHLRRGPTEVTVAVEDSGPGIPPEHLTRIFDRFYRVDAARSREMGGTGLGLSIVREIAALHGGRVEVESTVGKGSVFRVILPSARPA